MDGKVDPWKEWAESNETDSDSDSTTLTYTEEEVSLSEKIFDEVKIGLIWILGFGLLAALFSSLIWLSINDSPTPLNFVSLFFIVNMLLLFIVETWRLSTDFSTNLATHWERTTPPHSNEPRIPNLRNIIRRKLTPFSKRPPLHPEKSFSYCFSRFLVYLSLGSIIYLGGMIIGIATYESGFIDSTQSSFFTEDDYFLPVAYVSALMGPKFAAIVVTILAISISSEDAAIVVLLGIFPSYYLIPAMKNGIIAIEIYFENLLRR